MMDRYTARVLPAHEWDRLGLAPELLPRDPDRAVIIVIETEQGQIVGRWMAYDTTVLEGLVVAPEFRHKPGVAGTLLHAMTSELIARRVPMAITLITDPEVARLAMRHGLYPIEGQIWVLDLQHAADLADQHRQLATAAGDGGG